MYVFPVLKPTVWCFPQWQSILDAEGQKSNTGATPNRESNNVEVSEKKERGKGSSAWVP